MHGYFGQAGSNSADIDIHLEQDRTVAMDKALLDLATAIFNALHNLLENDLLYSPKEQELQEWLEVTKCNAEEGTLL